jgi:hypothetical protein
MSNIFTGPHAHLSIDRPLLRKLGLSLEPLPHRAITNLGTVQIGNVVVGVSCTAMPAKFWTFDFLVVGPNVKRAGHRWVERLETDSGSLTTYWPQVLATVEKLKGGRR